MALRFAMILEAVDRMSGPGRRALAGLKNLARGARDLVRGGEAGRRAMDRLRAAVGRMRGGLGPLITRLRQAAGRAGMRALELGAYGAGRAIGFTIRKVAGLVGHLAKLAAGGLGLLAGGFFGGVIATTAKFEQFQIMLEGTEGSAEKARKAMDWVREFAKTTPYELEQVMTAFVQLKAYGIDPLDGSLVAAGDAAAGMSKDLMQAVEALADAQTGEFERLKEFGIRARVEGNKVAFTYMKNGKEITRSTTNNAAQMKDAITGIWSDRFGGSMERQSKTFNGMLSNLKDAWSDFMLRVGQAGIFDKVKNKLQSVLDWLNNKLDDGTIDRWADNVSKQMEKVVDWVDRIVKDTDWVKFGADLKQAAEGFIAIGKGAAWAAGKVAEIIAANDRLLAWREARSAEQIENGWGYSEAQKKQAREGRQALEREHGPLTGAGRREVEQRANTMPIGMWQGRDGKRQTGTSPVRPVSRATPLNLRGTPINPRATATAPQRVAVGGKMEIELKAPPGWTATPTRMSSVNPAVPAVFRGKANWGWG